MKASIGAEPKLVRRRIPHRVVWQGIVLILVCLSVLTKDLENGLIIFTKLSGLVKCVQTKEQIIKF